MEEDATHRQWGQCDCFRKNARPRNRPTGGPKGIDQRNRYWQSGTRQRKSSLQCRPSHPPGDGAKTWRHVSAIYPTRKNVGFTGLAPNRHRQLERCSASEIAAELGMTLSQPTISYFKITNCCRRIPCEVGRATDTVKRTLILTSAAKRDIASERRPRISERPG